jgi:lipopolysaccharide/colanic/teichoic acid biosynthesis glycosyltransferase
MTQSGWRFFVKTAVDRAAGLVGLVVAAPVLVGAAVAVKATMGSPVLFRQRRPGRGERVFDIVKFRTMREATDERGNPLSDAERLTPVGRWLRATSVDELPQLWNVVRGELSLVGPRPLLVRYLPRYSPEQRRRHDVMPGITGWAQIHGRNAISWEEKFALDVWYVEHWSLALDARILIETVGRVLKRDGVSSDGHATMPEFEGTPAGT